MSRNPEYQFIDTGVDTLVNRLVAGYEAITKTSVSAASPEKLFIMWAADILLQERMLTNYVGNQNIPSRADGENLDALAEIFYTRFRPEAKPAVCTVRFRISEAQAYPILIPQGNRVTDYSGTLIWETTEDAYVQAGDTFTDIPVRCQVSGTAGNGWEPGQINVLVDLYDYCAGCENITVSDSGADRATDAEFYELLRASMDAFSTAGSEGSYVYHAKSVSTEIGDVKAIRPQVMEEAALPLYQKDGVSYAFFGGDTIKPETLILYRSDGSEASAGEDFTAAYTKGLLVIQIAPSGTLAGMESIRGQVCKSGAGEVEIFVLMDDGTAAGEEIKAAVLEACSEKSVRPMTDNVEVLDPVPAEYDIDMTYYIKRGTTGTAALIKAVEAAVSEYIRWQSARLGRDINPSKLHEMVMAAGVKRVEIRSPVYTVLSDGTGGRTPQLAVLRNLQAVNGGTEEE